MLEAKLVKDKAEWEQFVLSQRYSIFLQSSEYMEFSAAMGDESWIIGLYEGNMLIGGSLAIAVNAKRGRHLVLPYGPIGKNLSEEQLQIFFDFAKKMAVDHGFSFIRLSPFVEDNKNYRNILKKKGALKAPMHILAEDTWILDIQKNEQALLSQMNKNHRNLINRCGKEGVHITKTTDGAALDRLNSMHNVVAKRHHFHRFSTRFIEREFNTFAKNNHALIIEARLPDGRLDASAIIIFYGNMAAYRHSASLQLEKRLPTSYLIQWEAIKEAKKRGVMWYNFWGIAPEGASSKHPFFGITHFKKGFGGNHMGLLPCFDIPLKSRYYLTRYFEFFRSIKRGFK